MDQKRERRREERTDCDLPATLDVDGVAIPCCIVDISAIGARIAVAADVRLPRTFDLLVPAVPGVDQRFHIVTQWRDGDFLGGAFRTTSESGPIA